MYVNSNISRDFHDKNIQYWIAEIDKLIKLINGYFHMLKLHIVCCMYEIFCCY